MAPWGTLPAKSAVVLAVADPGPEGPENQMLPGPLPRGWAEWPFVGNLSCHSPHFTHRSERLLGQ